MTSAEKPQASSEDWFAFIDEPRSDVQSDPVWATEENYVRGAFGCEGSKSAVSLLLEPFLALQNRFEQVEVTPIQGDSDDMLSGWPIMWACTRDTALVMERRTKHPGRMEKHIYGMLSKKDPIKRINATSECMWRLLPRLEQAEDEAMRERRREARAQLLYCLLDDPDWRRLHSDGRRSPATKDMIEEAFRYASGKESSEQLVFQHPYSVLATWCSYSKIRLYVCSVCC